jgi:hypothetical protein
MIGALLAILSPFRKVLAWAAGAVVLLGGTWLAGRRDAKQDHKIETLEAEAEAHDTRNEVENRIAADRDAKRRLHDEWAE